MTLHCLELIPNLSPRNNYLTGQFEICSVENVQSGTMGEKDDTSFAFAESDSGT